MAASRKTSKGKGRKGPKSKSTPSRGMDQRLVKALSHELRERILIILNERVASPNELAKELNEGLSQVSYHVKVLKDYECIVLVKTEPRRGAVEHYYKAVSRPFLGDREWRQLPLNAREGLSGSLVQTIVDDLVLALEEKTFDARGDRHLSHTTLMLDERGWQDLTGTMVTALKRVIEIHEESGKRLAKSGAEAEAIHAMVAMAGVEMPAPARKAPGSSARQKKANGGARGKAKGKKQ